MPVSGTPQVSFLVEQLRGVPKKSKRAVRKAIVEATKEMRDDMAKRASWSTRIPSAIKVRAGFASGKVEIRVDKKKAPHARPYEGVGRSNTFRHPVFGRDVWVEQATRPFFFPAVREHGKKARDAVEKAVYASLPRL